MSALFGKCALDGAPINPQELEQARPSLVPYGPDGETVVSRGSVAILFRSFHTTKESGRETPAQVLASDAILAWDGRLDNREELIGWLRGEVSLEAGDTTLVVVAYNRWGTGAFARILGDWALSIWNPKDRSLVLAKDFVGTRPLYYTLDGERVTWSTVLDPLITLSPQRLSLSKEYIAGWLAAYPACHLTPYSEIRSVAPSCFVRLASGKHAISKYWDFNPGKLIRYTSDTEYEEHFRSVFSKSVQRRLRSDSPVLAELSGGMDSSSIVCMADSLIARGQAETARLDTISYFDDSEPNWDERPFVTKVEEKRSRVGCHLAIDWRQSLQFQQTGDHFAATPGSGVGLNDAALQLMNLLASQGNRVLLSGIGGDEVTGGVVAPEPELADLLVQARLARLARQSQAWALNLRKPWFHLLLTTLRAFLPTGDVRGWQFRPPLTWLHPAVADRYWDALNGCDSRWTLSGALPSFQENQNTLNMLRRQLGCHSYGPQPLCERRYPYLDRDLLEFLYAVPREQLLRPGQRRSLMRRALDGIVPDEVLNRRRKGYVARSPIAAIAAAVPQLIEISRDMISAQLDLVLPDAFISTIQRASKGLEVPLVPWMRTLSLELWLRDLKRRSLLPLIGNKTISAEEKQKKGGEKHEIRQTNYSGLE